MVQNCWDVDPTQTQYCEFFSQDLSGVSTDTSSAYAAPGPHCQPSGSSCCLLEVRPLCVAWLFESLAAGLYTQTSGLASYSGTMDGNVSP